MTPPPSLAGLGPAIADASRLLQTGERARGNRYVNTEGGDVAATGNPRSLVHHVANYVAAREVARHQWAPAGRPPAGTLVDVGSGVGALGVWLGGELGLDVHLVDADPAVRAVAVDAFPTIRVSAGVEDIPAGSAALVTAMEVVEHVARPDQLGFVQALAGRVAPGGVLAVSTPDETAFLGRWSGYGPHIGTVDAAGLEHLLVAATGRPATVWRLDGPAFRVGGLRRLLEPLGNRTLNAVDRVAPQVVPRLARGAGRITTKRSSRIPDGLLDVHARPAHWEQGIGLFGIVVFA